ncbi:MAG: O-antigen ligase family protein [Gammaproteobacteria bacterium]
MLSTLKKTTFEEIIILLTLLCYFVYFPVQSIGPIHITTPLFFALIVFVAISVLISLLKGPRYILNVYWQPDYWPLYLYAFFLLINIGYAISPVYAAKWTMKYYLIVLFVFYFFRKRQSFEFFCKALPRLGVFSALLLFVYMGLWRNIQPFYNNTVASMLVGPAPHIIALGLIYAFLRSSNRLTGWRLCYFALLFAALILWGSRSILIATLVGLFAAFFMWKHRYKWRLFSGIVVVLLMIILFMSIGHIFGDMPVLKKYSLMPLSHAFWQSPNIQTRANLWAMGLHAWQAHPWLGVGAGNFPFIPFYNFINTHDVDMLTLLSQHKDVHNLIIQLLCEQGVIGIVLFFVIVVKAVAYQIRGLWRGDEVYQMLFCFTLYMLSYSLMSVVFDVKHFLLLMLPLVSSYLIYHYESTEK